MMKRAVFLGYSFLIFTFSTIVFANLLSKNLTDFEYSFDVHTMAFESQGQGLTMVYMHLPAKEGQPTVVLLHGKNFASSYWETTANWLQGYRVVIPEQIDINQP